MVSSSATTVKEYLAALPEDRRKAIGAVRKTIRDHLPKGFEEVMQYGMISYIVPEKRYSETYNGQPLAYVSLASQKNHMAVYLMGIYGDETLRRWFEDAYRKTGKRMDIGKACVRFKTPDALPLDLVGSAVGAMTMEDFIALYEKARGNTKPRSVRSAKI